MKVRRMRKAAAASKPARSSDSVCLWSGMADLNCRPLRPERSALPGCANPRCAAHLARAAPAEGEGFEPPEPCGSADFESAALDQTMRPLRAQLYTTPTSRRAR